MVVVFEVIFSIFFCLLLLLRSVEEEASVTFE